MFKLSQEEMIELPSYFLSCEDYSQMTDFDKYYFSRELFKSWNELNTQQKEVKKNQLKVFGFELIN